MSPDRVRRRLVERRKQLGLTQEQLADKLDVPLRTFQKYEQGTLHPTVPVVHRWMSELAQVLLIATPGQGEWSCALHGGFIGALCGECAARRDREQREEIARLEDRIRAMTWPGAA